MALSPAVSRRCAADPLVFALLGILLPAQNVTWDPQPSGLGFGHDVARVGDLDADGADDFVVTRRDAVAEIVSGRTGALIRSHTCPPASGVVQCAGLGDVNGDGRLDYALSSSSARNPNIGTRSAGAGWVAVFSGASGSELWHSYGASWYTAEGSSIAAAGDVDGNGVPDLVVGSPDYPGYGASWHTGRAAVHDGLTGAVIWSRTGAAPDQYLGALVASCGGDTNGDGRPDVLVFSTLPNQVEIVSGATGALVRTLVAGAGQSWRDVDGLGDVDSDGVADLVVGMFDQPYDNGAAVVYSGATGAVTHTVRFTVGAWTSFGGRVRSLGDLTGDGVADFAVGTEGRYTYTQPGYVRVYDGAAAALLTCMDGSFLSGKRFGHALAAGDANGDGRRDILIGAPAFAPGTLEAGRVEVYGVLAAGTLTKLPHGCGPTRLTVAGQPRIGDRLALRVCGAVGQPVLGLGFQPLGLPFCGCVIGHEWSVQLFVPTAILNLPNDAGLIGAQFTAQGLDVGGAGGCAAPPFALTDSIRITIG